MKKVLYAALAVALVCGVIYIGVLIFGSMNVKQIEIVGTVQQVYFTGDEINFGDAKIRVTYHNGSVNLIDMNKSNIKVSLFSTSGHGKYYGTMKLTYKTQTIDLDYFVLDRTSYVVSSEKKITTSSTTNLYNKQTKVIDFQQNGVVNYFEIVNGKYYLNDGSFDKRYNYTISGDTIVVNLGIDNNGNERVYKINPIRNGNKIDIISKTYYYSSYNSELVNYIVESKFETTDLIKTNNQIDTSSNLELDYSKARFSVLNQSSKYPLLVIPENGVIDDSGVCVKVKYDNNQIYYVYITKSMLSGTFNQGYDYESFNINGFYEGVKFILPYKFAK